MARPISLDLRERVVRAVEAGSSRRGAARQFALSESFVIKLMQRWRARGTLAPAAMGGKKPYALAEHGGLVASLVAGQPDITLDELRGRLGERGIVVGRSSIGRFLVAMGLTRKKRRCTPPSRRGPMSPPRGRDGARASRA